MRRAGNEQGLGKTLSVGGTSIYVSRECPLSSPQLHTVIPGEVEGLLCAGLHYPFQRRRLMTPANSRSFDCVKGLASESLLSAQDDKRWESLPPARAGRSRLHSLLCFHGVDQLKKLGAVYNFDERLALSLVADHVNGWRVVDADALAQIFVLRNSGG